MRAHPRKRRGRQRAMLVLGTAILIAGLAGTTFFTVKQLRDNTLAAVETSLESRALTLAEEGNRLFKSLDHVLSALADFIAREGVSSAESLDAQMSTRAMHVVLRERLAGMPQTEAIAIVNAHGRLINFSRNWPIPAVDVADRDYYKALKADPSLEMFVSEPVENKGTGSWTIYLARRLNDPDGGFMGLLLGAISLQYFNNLYQATTLDEGSDIALMRDDGTFLAGFPLSGEAARAFMKQHTGAIRPATSVAARVQSSSAGRTYRVSARRLSDYPLLIVASHDEETALGNWSSLAVLAGLLTAGGAVLVLIAAYIIERWWSEQEQLNSALLDSEHKAQEKSTQLETTLANMSHALCMFDALGRLQVCNEQFARMYGLAPENVVPGTPFRSILEHQIARGLYAGSDPQAYLNQQLGAMETLTDQLQILNNGRIIAVSHKRLASGGWVSTHMDVTESERAQEQIRKMAQYDGLTGLANRTLFLARLSEAYMHFETRRERFNLLFFDLDQFKAVNDSLGHPAGDELLRQVAKRLTACTRQRDAVARFGGDEFAILQLFRGDAREAAVALAGRVLQAIVRPYDINGNEVIVGTSIGIAVAPEDGATPEALMKNADLALYRAKNAGRNRYEFFEVAMDLEARERRRLEMDLRAAMPRGEFEVYYQPVVSVAGRHTAGVEALLRWNHPRSGVLLPENFIPQAEENGLVVQLGEWVLRKACEEATRMPAEIKLAVNVSAVQFGRANLFERITEVLAATGFPPERLELEITETVLLQGNRQHLAVLERAKALGISIVLDDFGTGYSSLSYLRMFPFDKIKIDRSFVAEASTKYESAAIVCAIAGLARELGMETTAAGIETEDQLTLLRVAGCTYAQGFLFGRAAPFAKTEAFLRGEYGKPPGAATGGR